MIKNRVFIYFIFCCFLLQSPGFTSPSEYNSELESLLLEDLEVMKYHFSIKYAPAEWKKTHLNWDLEKEFEKRRQAILSGQIKNVKDYHKLLKSFLASTHDYHVNVSFYSTQAAIIPLKIKEASGHYYITEVNSTIFKELPDFMTVGDPLKYDEIYEQLNSIQVGDELLTFNDIPIGTVIEKIVDEVFAGNHSETSYMLATKILFSRKGSYASDVPNEKVNLGLMRKKDKKIFEVSANWLTIPEWIEDQAFPLMKKQVFSGNGINKILRLKSPMKKLIEKDFSVEFARELIANSSFDYLLKKENKVNQDKLLDFRLKSELPPLGKILWQSSRKNLIYAYLYQTAGKQNIGYFYLPSFVFEGEYDRVMTELIHILKIFNKRSAALVIDTTNNTGGNLLFMYAVLSLLTDRPLEVPMHIERIIPEDIQVAVDYLQYYTSLGLQEGINETLTTCGYPLTSLFNNQLYNYSLNIIETWKSGNTITQLSPILGIDKILPHSQVQYTKPLVVLINPLNLSCGDFFPAILQDNKRALLFGQRTGGAGGRVVPYTYTSRFGVNRFSITTSFAYRTNGLPIENLGVPPDIFYKVKSEDLLNKYTHYRRAVNAAVKKAIRQNNKRADI